MLSFGPFSLCAERKGASFFRDKSSKKQNDFAELLTCGKKTLIRLTLCIKYYTIINGEMGVLY